MCGIAGLTSRCGDLDPRYILRMTDAIHHRGPDDEGYLAVSSLDGRAVELGGADSKLPLPRISDLREPSSVLLGHRRLAVLDLSDAGHQPMANPRRDLWIVYNGEVYNHPDLRSELQRAGHRFRSRTDTEVVLAAYAEWGDDCVEHLDGMWAFVILDLARHRLFGSRDRFGVKPLYLVHTDELFTFASEIKAVLEAPGVERVLNPEAAFDLLVLGESTWSEQTLFTGIVEVPPATSFEMDLGPWRLRTWRHYSLPVEDPGGPVDPRRMAGYVRGVEHRLRASVRRRLCADVPLGSCLSGGIDSSSLVCLASRLEPESARAAFSASFLEPEADERRWALMAADHAGVPWLEVLPTTDELADDLDGLARCQDLPFMSPGVYAQHRVMRLARDSGVTVLLDGQGGDELFTGYAPFHDLLLFQSIRRLELGTFLREWTNAGRSPLGFSGTSRALSRRLARALVPRPLLARYRGRRRPPFEVLSDELWRENRDRWELVRVRELDSLNATLGALFSGRKLAALLRYEDRNSMWHSIEARTPYVDDRELVEYVFSIPGAYKIHRGWSKYLLREAMRGAIPDAIRLRRDKLGFATPARRWLDRLWPEVSPVVAEQMAGLLDARLDPARLWPILRARGAGGTEIAWRVVSFALWRQVFRV